MSFAHRSNLCPHPVPIGKTIIHFCCPSNKKTTFTDSWLPCRVTSAAIRRGLYSLLHVHEQVCKSDCTSGRIPHFDIASRSSLRYRKPVAFCPANVKKTQHGQASRRHRITAILDPACLSRAEKEYHHRANAPRRTIENRCSEGLTEHWRVTCSRGAQPLDVGSACRPLGPAGLSRYGNQPRSV